MTSRKLAALLLSSLAFVPLCNGAAYMNPVVKVADLGVIAGPPASGQANPQCRFTLIGSNLWFTTSQGGEAGVGTVSMFDPGTSNITQLATFDNVSGKAPWSASLMLAAGKAWFTTSSGGNGNKGTLVSIQTNYPYAMSVAFHFPTNNDALTNNYGQAPHSTPVQIGDDLWLTCSGGGVVGSAFGSISKYNLTTGMLTNMFSLDQTNYGRQPLGSSLVKVGNAYYYLTYAGGTNVAPGMTPTGGGILGRITFDGLGQPTLTKLIDLVPGFGSFPAGDVVHDGSNYLYFTTVGTATNPGAIVRYSMPTGQLTNVFTFVTNTVALTNYGKQPYGTPILYNNELYFTTLSGGTLSKGVLAKLNLADNTVTKLADMEGIVGLALGGQPQYGGGTLYTNPATGRISIYLPINKGGIYAPAGLTSGCGTILRVDMQPQPITTSISMPDTNHITLTWTGGYQPFDVLTNSAVTSFPATSWPAAATGINSPTGTGPWSVTLPVSGSPNYYYIRGQAQ